MSRILIKNARIYDQGSQLHLKRRDVLIERGKIVEIKSKIVPSGRVQLIESEDLCISPGWLDIGCYNGEPGMEHREDLNSLRNAAAHGGYTSVAPFPTTRPTVDNKGQVEYLLSKNNSHLVEIHPIGALTRDRNGKDMAELLDLAHAGAVAFSDGKGALMSEGQVQRSMLYLKGINGKMIYVVNTKKPGEEGQVNEGYASVLMGVEGIADYQEKVAVNTVLRQLDYTDSSAMIHNVTLGWSAEKIYKSSTKHEVSASVPYFNLAHSDDNVIEFDSNFKVLPPLRSENERLKLCKALEKGHINVITSNHSPKTIEEKDEPFGLSPFGASSIETTFSGLMTYAPEISLERIVYCLSHGPRMALGLPQLSIAKDQNAVITFFDPSLETDISVESFCSKSKNNPYLGKSLKGKVLGVINKSKIIK